MSCDFGFRAVSIPNEHTFLSYSRNDCDSIAPIAKLVSEKRPIWYDEGLVAGEKWESMIVEQVLSCKMALFFVSRDLLGRDGSYVCDEFRFVTNAPKPALCVWLDDLREFDSAALSGDLEQFWQGVSALPAVSVYDLTTNEEKANAIITAMDELLKKDPSPINHDLPKSETTPDPTPKPEPKPELPSKGGKFSKFLGSKLFKAAVAIPVAAAVAVGGTLAARQFLGNDEPTVDENGHMYVETINDIDKINEDDIVIMGEYEGKPIEWIVLDKKDDDVLLITKNILCEKPFDDSYKTAENEFGKEITDDIYDISYPSRTEQITKELFGISWNNSSLRNWLNDDFINSSFTPDEISLINVATIKSKNYIFSDSRFYLLGTQTVNGGYDTRDKIFLLSEEQYNSYSFDNEAIQPYWLSSQGVYVCVAEHYLSSGVIESRTEFISDRSIQIAESEKEHITDEWINGSNYGQYYVGRNFYESAGVRPAMWVHIGG